MTRPRAQMRLGDLLVGRHPWRSLPHGVVVYGEWDRADRTTYTWEEWQLTGSDGDEFWVEYDHWTHKVTLYRPVEVNEPVDPTRLRTGQQVTLTVRGVPHRLTVGEVGVGSVRHLAGTFTCDLRPGQQVAYAELKGSGFVLSVERYGDRLLDVYQGTVLDAAGQQAHFGKKVAPVRGSRNPLAVLVAAVVVIGLFVTSCDDDTVDECTPRTVVNPDGTTTTEEDCHRRSMYGSGGLGK